MQHHLEFILKFILNYKKLYLHHIDIVGHVQAMAMPITQG